MTTGKMLRTSSKSGRKQGARTPWHLTSKVATPLSRASSQSSLLRRMIVGRGRHQGWWTGWEDASRIQTGPTSIGIPGLEPLRRNIILHLWWPFRIRRFRDGVVKRALPYDIAQMDQARVGDSKFMMKPPRFEGKEHCIESHLVQFNIVAKRNGWDDSEKTDFLKCSLVGEASHLLRDLSDSATYDDIVYKLRQRYGSLEQMELKQRKRRPGESLSSLLKDVRRLFTQAYPGPPNYMSEIAAKDAFVEALNDRELMIKVCEQEPGTLDQACKIAEGRNFIRKFLAEKMLSSKRNNRVKSVPQRQKIIQCWNQSWKLNASCKNSWRW